MSQSQQQTWEIDMQEDEIKMDINFLYFDGTTQKLLHMLRSNKSRSTFYTENTFCKLLCKPKDWVATGDKNNIVSENDCSNCVALYFGESSQFLNWLSNEHERSIKNYDCEKNETVKHSWEENHNFNWDQKEVGRDGKWLSRKIKETIHFLRIIITVAKFPICFLKYSFLIYDSS